MEKINLDDLMKDVGNAAEILKKKDICQHYKCLLSEIITDPVIKHHQGYLDNGCHTCKGNAYSNYDYSKT